MMELRSVRRAAVDEWVATVGEVAPLAHPGPAVTARTTAMTTTIPGEGRAGPAEGLMTTQTMTRATTNSGDDSDNSGSGSDDGGSDDGDDSDDDDDD